MKLNRLFPILCVLICCFFMSPAVHAEGNTSGSGSSNPLLEGLMDILQESIDDFIGTYKGRLGEVKLLERRGNKVILEVTYDGVKRSDNVYVQGKVLNFSEELEGFSNTLNSISGSRGKVKLAIGWAPQGDDGWGTTVSQADSDQIRLYLVRDTHPDRPFGEIIYDMAKTWTDSDEPDQEAMAESDGIELEEGQAGSGTQAGPSIFVKPGTILKPRTPSVASTPQGGTATMQTPAQTQTPSTSRTTQKPATVKPQVLRLHKVQSYDFYKNAHLAKWSSSAGTIAFPGQGDKRKGYVRQISKGHLNSGNAAVQMLLTHPEQKKGGRIDGLFPEMLIDNKVRFKAVVGFLKNAKKTDGATFQVYVKENKRHYRVASKRVTSGKYEHIDADLSRWRGKKIRILLIVRAGNSAYHDWAVWVKPRLSK